MKRVYYFRPSMPGLKRPDPLRPTRQVNAVNESKARGRLGSAGPGCTWILMEVVNPPDEMPVQPQSVILVPVFLGGDVEAVVGFAEVRSDGNIELILNHVLVQEDNLPMLKDVGAISINLTYQGVVTRNRKA